MARKLRIPPWLSKATIIGILFLSGVLSSAYLSQIRLEGEVRETPNLLAPDRYTGEDAKRDKQYYTTLINRNYELIKELEEDQKRTRDDLRRIKKNNN